MHAPEETANYRELHVLKAIEADPSVSHRQLAKRLGLSSAVIQVVMTKLIKRGFVKMKGTNLRRIRYLVTPAGRKRFEELSMAFIRSSAKLFTETQQELARSLSELIDAGVQRVCLYGAGDVMDLVLLVLDELDFKVIGLIDDRSELWGAAKKGYRIESPATLRSLDPDGVLITAHGDNPVIMEHIGAFCNHPVIKRIA
jgi:DNA-binding MarR family transcriptional regulator